MIKLHRRAILIIHGYAGGVYDEEYLNHELELVSNYDVFSFTLPGHDDDHREKITYQKWLLKVDSEMKFLIDNGYTSIYVIGHSMGGVLASYAASKYKEVRKLVLLAPAFRVLGFEKDTFSIETLLHTAPTILEQYGRKIVANRIRKLPTSCYLELLKLIKISQDLPSKIDIPTLIFWGLDDKIVPIDSINHLDKTLLSKDKKIIFLEGITHDILRENKKVQVTNYIKNFLEYSNSIKYFPDKIEENDENKIHK